MSFSRRFILLGTFLSVVLIGTQVHATERVVVSSAASLRDVMTEIGSAFERTHPATKVALNFANSSQLAAQVELGAPVEVFATADKRDVSRLALKNLVRAQATFARNSLIVAVSIQSGSLITTIADLAAPGVRIIGAGKQVPVTTYTRQFLDKADAAGLYGPAFGERYRNNVASEEQDVRTLATKIAMGEGDAGIVYVTDITKDLATKVRTLPIPENLNVTTEYEVALLSAGANQSAGDSFYRFLLSEEAASYLRKYGFLPPR
jgi:molybdate transport system substrate-binding protein